MAVMESLAGPRSPYRSVWLAVAAILLAVGVAAAVLFISLSTVLIVLGLVILLYGSMHFSAAACMEKDPKPQALIVPAFRWSVRVGVVVLSLIGYAAFAGPASSLLLLVVAGTSPRVVAYLSDPTEAPSQLDGSQVDAVPEAAPTVRRGAADLSVEELCLAWRRSFSELRSAATAEERFALVSTRDEVLGELERRDPQAFLDWLGSGPRAAGDPTRYFIHRAN